MAQWRQSLSDPHGQTPMYGRRLGIGWVDVRCCFSREYNHSPHRMLMVWPGWAAGRICPELGGIWCTG